MFEHALCGWGSATVVHTLCSQGEGEGFLDYGVGKTGIFFFVPFSVGYRGRVFTQLMPLTCINPKVLCGCVSVCTCLAIKPLSSGN